MREPGFTIVAVLALGLGIGAATSVFSAVNGLLLRPLPFASNEDRLLVLTETSVTKPELGGAFAYPDYLDVRNRSKTLEGIWVHQDKTVIIADSTTPERVTGTSISTDAFEIMGVPPIVGRPFNTADDAPGCEPVALISHRLWKERFGGDPEIAGRTVMLNGEDTTIVGVMPKGWGYPETSDIWTPLKFAKDYEMRGGFFLTARAKMRADVTLEQVRAELTTIAGSIAKEHPMTNGDIVMKAVPIREAAVADTARLTILLMAAVSLVFLIACANVANLLLARGSARSKEIAIRLALGCPRRRIIQQLFTENLLLALLGSLAGILTALWGVDLITAAIPVDIPFWLRFDVDGTVIAFAILSGALASVIFGLGPALHISRPAIVDELKEGGRTHSSAVSSQRFRNALVVGEVAIALVLLVGAGLMVRSFLSLRAVNPGFCQDNVMTFRAGIPSSMVSGESELPVFFADVVARLRTVPGVRAAGATATLPGEHTSVEPYSIKGEAVPSRASDFNLAHVTVISPGYLETMDIPLKQGRDFDVHDKRSHPNVAIVDERFANLHFPGEDAVGKRFRAHGKESATEDWHTIIGVAGTIRQRMDRDNALPSIYVPLSQKPSNFMSVVFSVDSSPGAFASTARAVVFEVNPQIPIYRVFPMDMVIARSTWIQRFFARLFSLFAGVALFLAAIGIYGVMAYSVTLRTQEIGVRMALGAKASEVTLMVVHHGFRLVVLGIAIGLIAAVSFAHLLSASLYGVSPHDPPTFAVVPFFLALVAVLACWLPSRKATRIDPITALRFG